MNKILAIVILINILATSVAGHVGYVVEDSELQNNLGSDFVFLFSVFKEPLNITLMITTLMILTTLAFYLMRNKMFLERIAHIKDKTKHYDDIIPWIARLGVGIALIGAGSSQVFISPLLSASGLISTIEIITGFMILSGLLTGVASWAGIFLFLIALRQNFYLLGNLDLLALCMVIVISNKCKPGVDDLLGIPFSFPLKKLKQYIPLILRIGIGSAMIFLALYEKILNPRISELVVTQYNMTSAIPVSPAMWIFSAGSIEFIVAFAILIGFRTRLFAGIASIVLTASFFFFNEAVFSHVTLFSTLSILFIVGSGKFSLDEKKH